MHWWSICEKSICSKLALPITWSFIIVTSSTLQSKNQFHLPDNVVKDNCIWETTCNIFALIFFLLRTAISWNLYQNLLLIFHRSTSIVHEH
jgi:hypothetical protein